MTAALAYDISQHHPATATVPTLAVPVELRILFEESSKMKTSFWRLTDRDRRGFVHYIDETKSVMTRERRAAIVAMSLMGLARDIRDEGSLIDAR